MNLNLMCGTILLPGYVNCDIVEPYDVYVDATKPFPFEDNSADFIVCYHGLEHLGYPEEANHFLSECKRVLKSGGEIAIGVPDLVGVVLYLDSQGADFQIGDMIGNRRYHNLLLGTHWNEGHFHKWMYTEHTLKYLLEQHFNNVRIEKSEYDHGGPGLLVRGTK